MEDFARYSVEDVQDRREGGEQGAAAGEEGTRSRGTRKYTVVEDLVPLLSGISHAAEGTRSSGATKPTTAGDVTRLLGEIAKKP